MPFYQYTCPSCQNPQIVYKSASLYNREEFCEKCNAVLKRDVLDVATNYKNCDGFFGKSN